MRILVTGASSPLAVGVLRQLLLNTDWELWCGRHRKEIPITDPTLHVIDLDLESELFGSLTRQSFDMVIHFAGVTHASIKSNTGRSTQKERLDLLRQHVRMVAVDSYTSVRVVLRMAVARMASRN